MAPPSSRRTSSAPPPALGLLARLLAIAGSDSGAGAGIQADLKTATALGAYATTAITAITAQNTLGVGASRILDPDIVEAQIRAILEDIGADAIKTGMLGDARIVSRVASVLGEVARGIPLVVDPVMVAKGGAALLDDGGRGAILEELAPLATLLTPNTDEAAALTGRPIASVDDMERAAEDLLRSGASAVLVKGGHLDGVEVVDVLVEREGLRRRFAAPRIPSTSTHGTGCTLASAIATSLAQGIGLVESIERAQTFVREAILAAPTIGHGHGPMDHAAAGRATARHHHSHEV